MGQFLPEDEEDTDEGSHNGNHDYRRQVHQEVIEIQVGSRTDHDVWRVADHKSRTADVAHEDFRHQNRYRGNLQHTAEGNGHRGNEERRSNRIDKGCTYGSDAGEKHQQLPR